MLTAGTGRYTSFLLKLAATKWALRAVACGYRPPCTVLLRAMAVRIDDPELLIGHILAASKEVVAVARVEPHFVVTAKVREPSNDRTAPFVDDDGVRVAVRRWCVTAEQDLIARPQRHSLRCCAIDRQG